MFLLYFIYKFVLNFEKFCDRMNCDRMELLLFYKKLFHFLLEFNKIIQNHNRNYLIINLFEIIKLEI